MKTLTNKFVYVILLLILVVVGFQIIIKNTISYKDTNSYVILLKGEGKINNENLEIQKKQVVSPRDILSTIGIESLLIIEWGDGSISRLGGDSKMQVKEANINGDLTKINISVNLISGKIWSNVINFLGEDSYFNYYFNDIEAGVRGTVFSVDLNNEYIYSYDHDIYLKTKENKKYLVLGGQAFSIKTFNFIEIKDFFDKIIDKSWLEINQNFDKEYLLKIKSDLNKKIENSNSYFYILSFFSDKYKAVYEIRNYGNIDNINLLISKLDTKAKNYIYLDTLGNYQKLNFVSNEDSDFFAKKIFLKRILLSLAKEKDKELLVNSTLNDFNDTLKGSSDSGLSNIIDILRENKDIVNKINDQLGEEFKSSLLPEGVKLNFEEKINTVNMIFYDKIKSYDFSINSIKENLDSLKKGAEDKITDGLNNIYNKVIK